MSHQAVTWVLNEAQGLTPDLVSTALALAERADSCGRSAYPSASMLARQTRLSLRQVQRNLAKLEALGVIRRGDQSRARGLPPRQRPVVWDLAMRDTSPMTHRDTTSEAPRYVTHDRGDASPTSYKPSLPSKRKPTRARTWAITERELELAELFEIDPALLQDPTYMPPWIDVVEQ